MRRTKEQRRRRVGAAPCGRPPANVNGQPRGVAPTIHLYSRTCGLAITSVFLFCLPAFAFNFQAKEQFGKPQGYVNDFANILSESDRARIETLLTKVEEKTTAEIAVVTVRSLKDRSVEEYAVNLFKAWGIGKKGKDNGVLILVAPSERKARIEVGYGLEGVLPDGLCGEIIRYQMRPNFKKGRYGEGIWQAALRIAAIVGKEYNVDVLSDLGLSQSEIERSIRASAREEWIRFLIGVLFFGFWGFVFPFLIRRGGRRYSRGYWASGWGSGGGFGGGFGGFGGGGSGGGGASGSW